ncbi:MAG: TetR/AcrR family transcriptional regulator [Deltaproteobacteria bacterium]|nr:TetR/AcrR family transcriptional regulator [Deltaproteobacteria bacterium]
MMTRKEKEEVERKAHILSVAEELFAQKGLQNTSVADIAQAAEFGVGTLYRYFADRETLISSLLTQRITEHYDALEAAINSELTPPETIDRLIEAFLTSINRRRSFFKIYFTWFHPGADNTALSPRLHALEQRKWELFARVDDIYRKGIEQGYFLDVGDEGYLTATTWGVLMSFYFFAQKRYNGAIDVSAMKATIQQLLFEKVRLSA